MTEQDDKKKFSVLLPMAEYRTFTALGEDLGYNDLRFGEILLCYAIPRWEEAIDQRKHDVRQRRASKAE